MWGAFVVVAASLGEAHAAMLRRRAHGEPLDVQSFVPVRPNKCESCGSREFKQHHGQTVCAYCRSGA
jgi:hypothetical protein